ncbi:DNA-directed RNA polymerase I kDa polypeptide [Fistulina hepatica ATCC 64428]|uniref:DNA-directed RNA polymerase subunit n=1 Tax=Fistulina hepatica ATCC 64428 TaxID=1128425 RepID=A0A0D7A914_9AGAR|nr:DNA-directed RNA polymerase I kDa polypeptide [Fistulina hepatica ATCC 64428]
MPIADKIGSLLFCPSCGMLLDLPNDGESVFFVVRQEFGGIEVTTQSHPDVFPSPLRQKRKTQTKLHEEGHQGTLVAEKCPECGHMQAFSKEMQLRSADEGSTIFYTCASCKHGCRVNN